MSQDRVGWLQDHSALERHLIVAMRHAARALAEDQEGASEAAQGELARITRASDGAGTRRRFWSWMQTLGRQAQRMIHLHHPDCPCLGGDEAALLAIWQHLRSHQRGHATALARRLVERRAVEPLLRHAAVVAIRTAPPGASVASSERSATPRPSGPVQAARLH